MAIEDCDVLELKDRYQFLIKKYAESAILIAPEMDKLGRYRKELQLLVSEFVRRGVQVDDPEGIEKLVQQEINKRNEVTDQDQRDSVSEQDSG
jgi:hypothetical protein